MTVWAAKPKTLQEQGDQFSAVQEIAEQFGVSLSKVTIDDIDDHSINYDLTFTV